MTSSGQADEKDVLELARSLLGVRSVLLRPYRRVLGLEFHADEGGFMLYVHNPHEDMPAWTPVLHAATIARMSVEIVAFAHGMSAVLACREAEKKEAGA